MLSIGIEHRLDTPCYELVLLAEEVLDADFVVTFVSMNY